MNKRDMVELVRDKAGITKKLAAEVVESLLGEIVERAFNGESTVVQGFGVFSAKQRAARDFKSGLTEGRIKVAAHRALCFKGSGLLKRA